MSRCAQAGCANDLNSLVWCDLEWRWLSDKVRNLSGSDNGQVNTLIATAENGLVWGGGLADGANQSVRLMV